MNSMEDRLLSIECSLDNISDHAEASANHLKNISRELLISNLTKTQAKKQREFFKNKDDIQLYNDCIYNCHKRLAQEKDSAAADGFRADIADYTEKVTVLIKKNVNLLVQGCIDL